MKSNDLFRTLSSVTTAHPPFRKQNDIEVDDTAPLALFISIGLPVFIGFIILVLICCFCRRRRGPPAQGTNATQSTTTNYHRAPDGDGVGAGAYPMTAVTNPYMGYPPPGQPMGQTHYIAVPPGVGPPMHPAFPTQQLPPPAAAAHFAALQPYPVPPSDKFRPPPTGAPGHQSHSSQASSISGHTVDPLVPSAPHLIMQQQQQQQHLHLQQAHQQHQQELFHQQLQQQQQQLYHHHHHQLSHPSPVPPFHYGPPSSPFMAGIPGNAEQHGAVLSSTSPVSSVSQTLISPPASLPVNSKAQGQGQTTAMAPLRDEEEGTDQDLGFSEGE